MGDLDKVLCMYFHSVYLIPQDFDDIYVVMGMMETDLHKVEDWNCALC